MALLNDGTNKEEWSGPDAISSPTLNVTKLGPVIAGVLTAVGGAGAGLLKAVYGQPDAVVVAFIGLAGVAVAAFAAIACVDMIVRTRVSVAALPYQQTAKTAGDGLGLALGGAHVKVYVAGAPNPGDAHQLLAVRQGVRDQARVEYLVVRRSEHPHWVSCDEVTGA
jgi:hypothetical protein